MADDGDDINQRRWKRARGLTLPASAVGWISVRTSALDDAEDDDGDYDDPSDRTVRLLRRLLGRVVILRVSREAWPPPRSDARGGGGAGTGGGDDEASVSSRMSRSSRMSVSSRRSSRTAASFSRFGSASKAVPDDDCGGMAPISPLGRLCHELAHRPDVNMSLFPNVSRIVVDGVPPGWISHLDSLRGTLTSFEMEKGCLMDAGVLFFPEEEAAERNDGEAAEATTGDDAHNAVVAAYTSVTQLRLSNCAIGEAAGLRGRGRGRRRTNERRPSSPPGAPPLRRPPAKQPVAPPLFSRFPNLATLDLSKNELFRTKTALAGLSALPFLSSIDLSDNRLTSMEDVFLHIGNVKELILSGNELTSVRGLDRLYSLERLSLDHNNIATLANVAGIVKLPDLMRFDIRGNPLEQNDPAARRIEVLNLFRETRCQILPKDATYRYMRQLLPTMDDEQVTMDELIAMKDLTFRQASSIDADAAAGLDGTIHGKFDEFAPVAAANPSAGDRRRAVKVNPARRAHVRRRCASPASSRDGSSRHRLRRFRERASRQIERGNGTSGLDGDGGGAASTRRRRRRRAVVVAFDFCDVVRSIRPEEGETGAAAHLSGLTNDDPIDDAAGESDDRSGYLRKRSASSQCSGKETENDRDDDEDFPNDDASETRRQTFPYRVPPSILAEADDIVWDPRPTPWADVPEPPDFGRPVPFFAGDSGDSVDDGGGARGAATTEPADGGDGPLQFETSAAAAAAFPADRISESGGGAGGCGDEFPHSPLPSSGGDEEKKSASDAAAGVADCSGNNPFGEGDENKGEISKPEARTAIIRGMWQQAYRESVATTAHDNDVGGGAVESSSPVEDEFRRRGMESIDCDLAERNAVYDGHSDYAALYVSSDLDLYYDAYVFPCIPPDENESNASEDDGDENKSDGGVGLPDGDADRYTRAMAPRVQLYKFDRESRLESAKRKVVIFSEELDFREGYIGVWREDVLACGTFARSRLSPARTPRRGFHGETTMSIETGREAMVCEGRRFVVCLSDQALYFVVDDDCGGNDKLSSPSGPGGRSFPSRIPVDAEFDAALWPHAVARHPLDRLQGITIGFQFQRLTLRFSAAPPGEDEDDGGNPSPEYAYVLFTSNKLRTISLLQKLQAQQAHAGGEEALSSAAAAVIENDDKAFLDALSDATSSDVADSGTVVSHYQVLRQVWKKGNREAIRRAFVLTDSRVFLLDETYRGDGTRAEGDDEDERERGYGNDDASGLSKLTENSDDPRRSRRKRRGEEKRRPGDVAFAVVDSSPLSQITEVRAANADPRMITLVVAGMTKFARSHRWRMVCADGEGAERLIDDVRKAIGDDEASCA